MMDPVADITIRRGNNAPAVSWVLEGEDGQPLPVVNRSFILTVKWRGGSIRKDTASANGFVLDPSNSSVTWTPTLAESRLIPLGRIGQYELECLSGPQQVTIVTGAVTGVGGLNND